VLTATADDGCTASTEKVIGVSCEAIASFTPDVDGMTATFDTAGSVGSLSFNYGDGTVGEAESHTYAELGTYTVTLTATGASGCTGTSSKAVVIEAENTPPAQPVLDSPGNGAVDVSLTTSLTAGDFSDADGDTHAGSEVQVSDVEDDFSATAIVYNQTKEGATDMTSFEVPASVLDNNTTYYWRIRYTDSEGGESEWSEVWAFTTLEKKEDGGGDDNCFISTAANGSGPHFSAGTALMLMLMTLISGVAVAFFRKRG